MNITYNDKTDLLYIRLDDRRQVEVDSRVEEVLLEEDQEEGGDGKK